MATEGSQQEVLCQVTCELKYTQMRVQLEEQKSPADCYRRRQKYKLGTLHIVCTRRSDARQQVADFKCIWTVQHQQWAPFTIPLNYNNNMIKTVTSPHRQDPRYVIELEELPEHNLVRIFIKDSAFENMELLATILNQIIKLVCASADELHNMRVSTHGIQSTETRATPPSECIEIGPNQFIQAMPVYIEKSFEEVRFKDYTLLNLTRPAADFLVMSASAVNNNRSKWLRPSSFKINPILNSPTNPCVATKENSGLNTQTSAVHREVSIPSISNSTLNSPTNPCTVKEEYCRPSPDARKVPLPSPDPNHPGCSLVPDANNNSRESCSQSSNNNSATHSASNASTTGRKDLILAEKSEKKENMGNILQPTKTRGTTSHSTEKRGTTVVRYSAVSGDNNNHHVITAMKEYEGKSFEELREEDYLLNGKGPARGFLHGCRPKRKAQDSPVRREPSNSVCRPTRNHQSTAAKHLNFNGPKEGLPQSNKSVADHAAICSLADGTSSAGMTPSLPSTSTNSACCPTRNHQSAAVRHLHFNGPDKSLPSNNKSLADQAAIRSLADDTSAGLLPSLSSASTNRLNTHQTSAGDVLHAATSTPGGIRVKDNGSTHTIDHLKHVKGAIEQIVHYNSALSKTIQPTDPSEPQANQKASSNATSSTQESDDDLSRELTIDASCHSRRHEELGNPKEHKVDGLTHSNQADETISNTSGLHYLSKTALQSLLTLSTSPYNQCASKPVNSHRNPSTHLASNFLATSDNLAIDAPGYSRQNSANNCLSDDHGLSSEATTILNTSEAIDQSSSNPSALWSLMNISPLSSDTSSTTPVKVENQQQLQAIEDETVISPENHREECLLQQTRLTPLKKYWESKTNTAVLDSPERPSLSPDKPSSIAVSQQPSKPKNPAILPSTSRTEDSLVRALGSAVDSSRELTRQMQSNTDSLKAYWESKTSNSKLESSGKPMANLVDHHSTKPIVRRKLPKVRSQHTSSSQMEAKSTDESRINPHRDSAWQRQTFTNPANPQIKGSYLQSLMENSAFDSPAARSSASAANRQQTSESVNIQGHRMISTTLSSTLEASRGGSHQNNNSDDCSTREVSQSATNPALEEICQSVLNPFPSREEACPPASGLPPTIEETHQSETSSVSSMEVFCQSDNGFGQSTSYREEPCQTVFPCSVSPMEVTYQNAAGPSLSMEASHQTLPSPSGDGAHQTPGLLSSTVDESSHTATGPVQFMEGAHCDTTGPVLSEEGSNQDATGPTPLFLAMREAYQNYAQASTSIEGATGVSPFVEETSGPSHSMERVCQEPIGPATSMDRAADPFLSEEGAKQSAAGPSVMTERTQQDITGPSVSVEGAHQNATGPSVSVEEAHQRANGPSVSVEEAHQSATGLSVSVEGAQQAATGPSVSVEGALQSASGSSVSVEEANQSATGLSVSVEGAQQAATGPSVSVEGALQSATGSSVSVEEAQQAATGSSVSVEGAQQGATGPSVSEEGTHQSATGPSLLLEGARQGATGPSPSAGAGQGAAGPSSLVDGACSGAMGPSLDTKGACQSTNLLSSSFEGTALHTTDEFEEIADSKKDVDIKDSPQKCLNLLASFQEELTCAICTAGFTDPKDLDCRHTFCRACLQGWLDTQLRKKSIPCPVCRHVTFLGKLRLDSLRTNIIIRNLSEQVRMAMKEQE